MEKAEGKEVTTLEGFDPAERDRLADAFAVSGALQCGFCTPGILVRTKALLDQKGKDLTIEAAAGRLGGHLCRCTGYTKIFEAIENLRDNVVEVPQLPKGIGDSGIKYEARELALGDRGYVDDMRPESGFLHAALRLADHARADVVAIDLSPGLVIPGVITALTADDIPGELRVGIIQTDWPIMIPEGDRTSYLGDVVAIVIATSVEVAREASAAVDVEYRVHQPFVNVDSALATDEDAVWGLDGNVLSESSYARGDVDAALAESAHVVTETFYTQRVEHAFLEPESTLAIPHDDRTLTVYSGGQGV